MAAKPDPGAIIIKRPRKAAHEEHHGGMWKVAYADFVTAMMAFFLLLWLLNSTTEAQKQGISDYFSPSTVSTSSGGAGGMLGGRAISSPGAMTSRTAVPSVSLTLEPTTGASEGKAEEDSGGSDKPQTAEPSKSAAAATPSDGQKAARAAEAAEDARFDEVEKKIRQAVHASPELKELEKQLLVDRTPDGLRIQIVDQDGKPMFPRGSAKMYDRTEKLLQLVAKAIQPLPNKVSITGHTDSIPYRNSVNGYGNWELSSDRAQASRRLLVASGLDPKRIVAVAGRADREPLLPKDPTSPRNRRISILLHREPVPAPAAAAATGKSAGVSADAVHGTSTPAPTPASASAPTPAPKGELKRDWTGPRVH